jgi:hypothetical protein
MFHVTLGNLSGVRYIWGIVVNVTATYWAAPRLDAVEIS